MTNERIQIEVAMLAGWKHRDGGMWYHPKGGTVPDNLIPNYTTSLDACAEFEKDAPSEYWTILARITNSFIGGVDGVDLLSFGKATPLQRCEAFLRLHGKWEE
jgi:hypothetical protein